MAKTPPVSTYDVFFCDGYVWDLTFTGLPEMPRLGTEIFGSGFQMTPGASFYSAVAFHRLGLRAGWSVDIGNDPLSRFFLETAQQEGLDCSLIRIRDFPIFSVTTSLSFPHNRAFVTYANEPPSTPLMPLIEQYHPRLLLLSSLGSGLRSIEWLAAIRKAGTKIFLECQVHQTSLDNPDVIYALQSVDIFAPNEQEALELTGAADVEAALAKLAELTPLVVIKLGPLGAIAKVNGKVVHVPVLRVKVLDTTGAGDIFNTGFIYGYLGGEPIEKCLMYGNICGGLSTTGYGVRNAPTIAQVKGEMSHYAMK
ncbi:MAG: carbohydrate kinase family protein [Chloroflexota bacterium]|nr:carbohydrate kinase family protein [Chloroflexota bacterium]